MQGSIQCLRERKRSSVSKYDGDPGFKVKYFSLQVLEYKFEKFSQFSLDCSDQNEDGRKLEFDQ
jgi:hypothetical protein